MANHNYDLQALEQYIESMASLLQKLSRDLATLKRRIQELDRRHQTEHPSAEEDPNRCFSATCNLSTVAHLRGDCFERD